MRNFRLRQSLLDYYNYSDDCDLFIIWVWL